MVNFATVNSYPLMLVIILKMCLTLFEILSILNHQMFVSRKAADSLIRKNLQCIFEGRTGHNRSP